MTAKAKKRLKKVLTYLSVALLWLLLWQGLSCLLAQELLLPAPGKVVARLLTLLTEKDFYLTVATTLLRVLSGMLAGLLLGLLGGILTALCPPARAFLAPALAVIKATPVASFIILLVLWVSRDATPALIAGMMVLTVMWENTEAGIKSTDPALKELARAYQMPLSRRLRYLYLPTLTPYLISAARASLGLSWKAGIAAEVLLLPLISVGKQIYESKLLLETTDLFAWTAVVILLSVLIEKGLAALLTKQIKGKETPHG